jgi:hypothetical protein
MAQTVQPFGQGLPVVGGLVLADFNASHCSLKATNWERVAFGCDAAGSAKDRFNLPVSCAIDGFRSSECFRPRRDDAAMSSSTKSERANGEVRARKGGVCS